MDAADAHFLLAFPRSCYFCSLCAACGRPFCQLQMSSQPHCSAVETACLSPDRFASLWLCCAMLGCCAVALTCVCVCFVLALPGAPVVKIRQMPFGARRKKTGLSDSLSPCMGLPWKVRARSEHGFIHSFSTATDMDNHAEAATHHHARRSVTRTP